MDSIDERILAALAEDGRMTFQQLGLLVGLSANSAASRVRKLLADEVILGIHATVSPAALGHRLVAIIDLNLDPDRQISVRHFEERLAAYPRVLWGGHMTGAFDYQLRVSARDADDLHEFIVGLKKELGVKATHTRLVLKELRCRQ